MLNKLFGSDQKIKILSYFFSSENNGYLSKEISKHLEQKGPSVKRDLSLFTDLGVLQIANNEGNSLKEETVKQNNKEAVDTNNEELLESSKKTLKLKTDSVKKKKIDERYCLNTSYLLYKELKSLFEKIKFLTNQEVFDKIIEKCQPKSILLLGKFVNDFESPIDILIVGDFSKIIFKKYIVELEGLINEEINYTIFTEEEYFYRQTISDIFLYNLMERKKINLCG